MNARTIATLAVAILLGLIAVILVRGYLGGARAPPGAQQAQVATVPVVVAAKPIDRGVSLTPELLKVVRYPADASPPDAFQNVAQLTGPNQAGRLALRSMSLNEPLLASKISGPGGKLTLATTVNPGMRAVSLGSNDIAGVAGFVLPGDKVDILFTRGVEGGGTIVQALAQDVLVLGIDQSANDESDKPAVARAVTVEVTPQQAAVITLARSVGQMSLTLRHVADDAPLARQVTTVADLGYGGPRLRAARGRAPVALIEVRVTRGVDTTGYSVAPK
jgi:pilus assembly protein CpaB